MLNPLKVQTINRIALICQMYEHYSTIEILLHVKVNVMNHFYYVKKIHCRN
jgi:hypothetical protein